MPHKQTAATPPISSRQQQQQQCQYQHDATHLTFTPETNLEHMALLQVCCVLAGRYSLQELHIQEGAGCDVTLHAWMQLGQLRGLNKLSVHFWNSEVVEDIVDEAQVFLTSLSGCRSVHLSLPVPTDPVNAFGEALEALREKGLPTPDVVVVRILES
jgi:hypothetical protein